MFVLKLATLIIFLADTCTELPAAVSDMVTTSTFPVIVGTVVEVNCKPGHTLAGDNTITCIRDVSFTIGQRPTCTIGSIVCKILNKSYDLLLLNFL